MTQITASTTCAGRKTDAAVTLDGNTCTNYQCGSVMNINDECSNGATKAYVSYQLPGDFLLYALRIFGRTDPCW